jgi:hypothetical protein
MSTFNLEQFVAEVKGTGLARVNRFEIQINLPSGLQSSINFPQNITNENARLVSLFAEISNLPPVSLNVKPFKIYGPVYQRPTGIDYGGDGLSMTFHVDRTMNVKRFFDDWIETVVNRDTFNVSYERDYVTKIVIKQLDEKDNTTYEIELEDAFPRSLSMMELNNSAQNQTHRLNVVFAYRRWRRTDNPVNQETSQAFPTIPLAIRPVVDVDSSKIKNVTYTGVYSPGTTNEDSAFGLAGGNTGA